MSIWVYHGGTEPISKPLCHVGRKGLDFGLGFYVTDLKEQAIQWAIATAKKRDKRPLINIYRLDREGLLREAKYKIFNAYDTPWLEFIIANRSGLNASVGFDYIEGGIANDRVIDTINLYMAGLMSIDVTLKRLSLHLPNNQICLLNQDLTDKYLLYHGTEPAI